MTTRRWLRAAMVTTVVVGLAVGGTATAASARPRSCNLYQQRIQTDENLLMYYNLLVDQAVRDGDIAAFDDAMAGVRATQMLIQGDSAAAARAGC